MDVLQSKELLLDHVDLQHHNPEAELRRLGLPEALIIRPAPAHDQTSPGLAYELTGLSVKPASLTLARHDAIGPWVWHTWPDVCCSFTHAVI